MVASGLKAKRCQIWGYSSIPALRAWSMTSCQPPGAGFCSTSGRNIGSIAILNLVGVGYVAERRPSRRQTAEETAHFLVCGLPSAVLGRPVCRSSLSEYDPQHADDRSEHERTHQIREPRTPLALGHRRLGLRLSR